MSVKNEEIVRALKALVSPGNNVLIATVLSIDETAKTITVEADGVEYSDVRLTAINDTNDLRSCIIPALKSWVLISFIEGSDSDAFVVMFSNIEKYIANANEIIINKGENGGLIIIADLVKKINDLEKAFNSLAKKYNTHIHITTATVSATPVPGVIAPTTTIETTTLVSTVVADIENPKIKH